MKCDETAIRAIALQIFGSEDYESMLAILPHYDGMVKLFNKEVSRLQQQGGTV